MGVWTLLIMLLLVLQLPVKYAAAQVSAISDVRNTGTILQSAPKATSIILMRPVSVSPTWNPRAITMTKAGSLPLNHYKNIEWSTFSLHYNNNNAGDDWLNEHNMVVVKSIIHIANRLIVGINCHYNWSFIIAGNGAGMVLNKLPVKIYFAGVMGGAPDLGHR